MVRAWWPFRPFKASLSSSTCLLSPRLCATVQLCICSIVQLFDCSTVQLCNCAIVQHHIRKYGRTNLVTASAILPPRVVLKANPVNSGFFLLPTAECALPSLDGERKRVATMMTNYVTTFSLYVGRLKQTKTLTSKIECFLKDYKT